MSTTGTPFRAENEAQARALAFLQFDVLPDSNVGFPKPGDRVADFLIEREIGRGGMGVVYRALQVSVGRSVALKLVPHDPAGLSSSELLRLQREGRMLASVRHEAIVGLHAAGAVPGFHYVAVDLIDGVTLKDVMLGRAPMLPHPGEPGWLPFVLRALHKIAGALGAAHQRGIVHRDVKPANVLVDRVGRPFLVDFGLAREDRRTGATLTSGFVGTPQYASPEQARGELLDPRSDVFSFGAMAFEALCGRSPFEGSTTSGLLESVQRAAPAWPDPSRVPRDVRIVLETCLEKCPQDRYDDARDVEAELGRILRFEPIHASSPGKIRRLWRRLLRPSTRVVTISAIGALLVVTATMVGMLVRRGALLERLEAGARLVRVDQLFQHGDTSESEEELARLVRIEPPIPGAAGRLADLHLFRRENEAAAALYGRETAAAGATLADWCGLRLARAGQDGVRPVDDPSVAIPGRTDRDFALFALYREAQTNFDAALEAIDRALELRPSCFEWRRIRARNLTRLGRTADAIRELRLASEIRRNDRSVTLSLAVALESAGRQEEAEAVVRSTLSVTPDDPVLVAELSCCLRRSYRRREAMETARRAYALAPDEGRAIDALAFNLMAEESFDEARALLTAAGERHGDSPEIVYRRACLERMTGHLALAEELEVRLEAMARRDDAWTAMALGLKGDLQMDRGCEADAVETFARLESSEPESAEWPWRRGKALLEDGRVAEAEASVRRSLELDPSRTDVLYTHGRVLRLLGRRWDALVAYERALALKPDWGQTYYWIADVWFDLGEPRVSLRYLREALARHPNWMDAWVLQAICHRDLGDLDDAIDSYARALEERSHAPVRADRAELLQRVGRDREALVEFERAIHDDPNLPTAWCGEGILRLDSEDPSIRDPFEAMRLLRRALELDPDNAEYCDVLSRARITLGLD
ncbi:MAG: tetratricopeptide repeat protein [Planctomycetes bacterium]|nr:tetratricopeptide repeat protein [Planctomycetota bacterium]MBI3845673.1 tetratricopeptide repeat protein [Planctomycetota bacterium]